MENNKSYFYQSDGEGIRMELVHLVNCIKNKNDNFYINEEVSCFVSKIIGVCLKNE